MQPNSEPNYTHLAAGPPVTPGIWTVGTTRSRSASGFDPDVSGHVSVAESGNAGKMSPSSCCYGLSPADRFPGIKGKSEAPLHLAFDMLMPEIEGDTGQAITLLVFHHHDPRRKFTGIPWPFIVIVPTVDHTNQPSEGLA